jgi:two-component system cell cycle sensor histidine kinase/response regulator CckA
MENNPLKILAIDDNEDNLTSVKALIREAFPQALILTATEAGKGIELAQAENPDVILLDVVMPGLDGFGACRQLKSNPLTRYIPVVFLTAIKGEKEARIRALEVGAEAFLSKPIDEIELAAQIRAMQKIKAAGERERGEKENLTELVAARTHELELAHTATLNLLEDLREENTARVESEAHLRLLFENLPSGVVVHAADTAVLFANPEALRLLGLTLEQMQGKTATDPAWCFLREDGGALPLEDYPVNRLRTSGKSFAGQIVGIRLPGRSEPNWVQCGAYPQRDASGQISQVIVAFTDITERKLAEDALRESKERFKAIANYAVSWESWFGPDGEYIWVNPAVEHFTGYSAQEILALPDFVSTVIADEDRAMFIGRFQQAIRGSREENFEFRYLHKNGTKRWLSASWQPIYDAQGNPLGTRSSGHDITVRKRAEAALEASEKRFKELLRNVPTVAVQGYAVDGTVRYWNRASESFYGYTAEEALGKNLLNLIIPPVMRDAVRAGIRRMIETRETPPASELELMHRDGTLVPVYSSHTLVQLPGQEPEMFCIDIDLTGIKRAEAEREALQAQLTQAQKMESVGRLAGGVAHDFNNMLGVIIGHTEFAMEKAPAATPLHADLVQIHQAAQRSASLTRQLLAFARKQTVTPKVLDLNDTIGSMLNLLRPLIGENITLVWKPGPDLWPVRMDPTQIEQILTNLCVNSRDAISDVGLVTVETGNTVFDSDRCGAHAGVVPGEYVVLAASDNGCGMDSDTLPHLFEPFFTTKQKGTGLGLAIVHGVVKQSNGFIEVHSKPGEGTTIRIYLPRHAAGTAAEVPKEPGLPAAGRACGTILLVEDEPMLLYLGKTVLERLGYTVLAAATPGDAIRLTREGALRIDLLMTDVVMPEMNGLDLAKTLLSIKPGMRLLFMSGYTADVIAHRGNLDEGTHFIQKPFSIANLELKLQEVMQS